MSDDHVSNGDLSPALVPSSSGDFSDEIYPFAMTYDGYRVWGDRETLAAVAGLVWDKHRNSGALPESLTLLRSSLFAAGRDMRFTDFDEDVFGLEGSGADFERAMRDHVAAIAGLLARGPSWHRVMAEVAVEATAQLERLEAVHERDVQKAFANALRARTPEHVWSSATKELRFQRLPLWEPARRPGPFDLVVGSADRPRMAAEVKWSGSSPIAHALWDVVKLIAVLALGAEQIYLIGGYPTRVWEGSPFATLYTTGTVRFADVAVPEEWGFLDRTSAGRPLRLPNMIEVNEVTRLPLMRLNESWELRVAAIDLASGGWTELHDGHR